MNEFNVIKRKVSTLRAEKKSIGKVNNANYSLIVELNSELQESYRALVKAQRISYSELERESVIML